MERLDIEFVILFDIDERDCGFDGAGLEGDAQAFVVVAGQLKEDC